MRRIIAKTGSAAAVAAIALAVIIAAVPVRPCLADAVTSKAMEQAQERLISKAPAPKPIDYSQLTKEAAAFLSKYIQINTTNPPGNELPAAQLIKEKFLADGIPATIWQPQPGRGIVAARLHGKGHHTKAIILLSHMDVVPATAKDWKVPPFSGAIKNGEIWGRGALDDKGPGVVEMMAMIAIKRAGILLNRDVLFVATGDEEEGGKNGAGWFVTHETNVFSDAHYLLNEGGAILVRPNGRRFFAVSVTEKTPLWIQVTATGTPGHAAVPPEETAVTRLMRALVRLDAYRPHVRLLDPVNNYFRALAELDGGPPQFLHLGKWLHDPAFMKSFLAVPAQNALVRDTITPTMLSAGEKINVIPDTASAELDCRLLPGENPKNVLAKIQKVIDDKRVKLKVLLNFPAVSSPSKSDLMAAIERLARRDHSRVVPTMTAGFTDSHYFRQKGIISYGFIPIELTQAEERTIHSNNERIPVKSLGAGIRRMVELLEFMGGVK